MRIFSLLTLLASPLLCAGGAEPAVAFPISDPAHTQSLDGPWAFKYLPSLDPGAAAAFKAPTFDASAWKTIRVPSCWELQGFADPRYDLKLADGLGLYRRTFRVPADWRGDRRVILRFEGVAYGFEAWVNGVKVGASSASAYNPDTLDITDALKADPGADNLLAVQVSTKPFCYEFDVNDDWSLSGIYRDVTLLSIPATHVEDIATDTKLDADGSANFSVGVRVNRPGAQLAGQLVSPDGATTLAINFATTAPAPKGTDFAATVRVPRPSLWTAETPSLYTLRLTLADDDGRPLQTFERRVGLREISINDGVLLLNGRPIKLRGVDHHDLDPIDGRAITADEERRDLELMKRANINHIRTSHYPPQPRFLELCDEMGFYVMDEVPLGSRGAKHLADPACLDNILARAAATVERDKNHASVIIWSIGNENPWRPSEVYAARLAKKLDPARPVCVPQTDGTFEKTWPQQPKDIDVYSPHYPTDAELALHAKTLKRPVIYSEFVHAWGLGFDDLENQWAIMQASPRIAGGAIWMFQDQGLLLAAKSMPSDYHKPRGSVWPDRTHLYDTHDADGCDGIVYSDRTPQVDFFETRKVFSPVQIAETSAAVKPGERQIALTIENRHDFRSLSGMTLAWSLRRDGADIQHGEIPLHAASHATETVRVPVNIPADADGDVLALDVRCLDEKSMPLTERAVRLDLPAANPAAWTDTLKVDASPTVDETAAEIKITTASWALAVNRATGALTLADRAGHVLIAGIYPHTGRRFTLVDGRNTAHGGRGRGIDIWPQPILTQVDAPKIEATQVGASVILSVGGVYPRPDKAGQGFVGGYRADIAPNGVIKISYDYAPEKPEGYLLEGGLSLVLPGALTEFRWIGQGPYPAYPGKSRLDEFGLFHLNREDLYFQGNRPGTGLALMTTPAGSGVALETAPGDVAVERQGDTTLLSHNAVLSGPGNKGCMPTTVVDLKKGPAHIAGSFTLVPLGDAWPAPLVRWFGEPAPAIRVFRPFFESYDQ